MTDAKTHEGENERARARQSYRERDKRLPVNDWHANIYHPRHPLGHLFNEHNHTVMVRALNRTIPDLVPLRILDVGCGHGHWLRYLVELGAQPEHLTGIDISEQRLAIARARNPAIQWVEQKGDDLPFCSAVFDLVMQVVVFSSILDEGVRRQLATEMSRVTRPGGYLIWLDIRRDSPGKLMGFSQAKVLEYFSGHELIYEKPVHPRYFRRGYRRLEWLYPLLYSLAKIDCESLLLVLRKANEQPTGEIPAL